MRRQWSLFDLKITLSFSRIFKQIEVLKYSLLPEFYLTFHNFTIFWKYFVSTQHSTHNLSLHKIFYSIQILLEIFTNISFFCCVRLFKLKSSSLRLSYWQDAARKAPISKIREEDCLVQWKYISASYNIQSQEIPFKLNFVSKHFSRNQLSSQSFL